MEETEEDLDKTFSLMERLFITGCDKLYLHRFFPLPCTEEADKIYDKLYFTPDEVDSSIYARRTIDDEGLPLIRKHKELFLPFYTFDSPIRKKYVWIEATVAFLSYTCLFFPESAKYLIRRYGIKGLYARCQDMFRELQLELGEMLSDGRSKQLVVKYLNRIHKILSDDPFFLPYWSMNGIGIVFVMEIVWRRNTSIPWTFFWHIGATTRWAHIDIVSLENRKALCRLRLRQHSNRLEQLFVLGDADTGSR